MKRCPSCDSFPVPLVLLLSACAPAAEEATPTPTVTVTVTAQPEAPATEEPDAPAELAPAPLEFGSDGETNTARFEANGDYRVNRTTSNDCYYGANLESTDRQDLFTADGASSGETYVYGLSGGVLHLDDHGPAPLAARGR